MIALAIISVAALGALRTLTSSSALGRANGETSVAYHAARRIMEEIKAQPFDEVFRLYNDDPEDDPGGAGTADGGHFAVAGLDARADDADGFVGRVLLPLDDAAPEVLRENLFSVPLGTPRDLDLDGVIDGLDHAGDYALLPVVVRIDWRGAAGRRRVELATILEIELLHDVDAFVRQAAHEALRSMSGESYAADPERWAIWFEAEERWFAQRFPELAEKPFGSAALWMKGVRELTRHRLYRRHVAEVLVRRLRTDGSAGVPLLTACLIKLDEASVVGDLVELTRDAREEVRDAAHLLLVELTGRELPDRSRNWERWLRG